MQIKHRTISLDFLDKKLLPEFRQIVADSRADFIAMIENAKPESMSNLDWYVTSVATRNTYLSTLYSRFCLIMFVEKIISRNEVEEIHSKSPAIRRIIRAICRKNNKKVIIKCSCKDAVLYYPRILLARNRQFLRSLWLIINRFWYVKTTRPLTKDAFKESLICIGTYIYHESFKGDFFTDRHFPGLLENLSDNLHRIRLVPTFFGVKYTKAVISTIRNNSVRFILKDDYLTISDYIKGLLHGFRIRWFSYCKKTVQYKGINFWPLIMEELKITCHNFVSIDGILNYQFIKRLNKREVQIENYLDWFENQSHSRGIILGLNTYYQKTESTGYLGFPLMRDYLCLYPTASERKNGILPKRIMVIGSGYVNSLKEFDKDLVVCVGPALRFKGVFRENKKTEINNDKISVLIALASVPETCNEILAICSDFLTHKEINLFIRRHPSMTESNCKILVSRYFRCNQYSLSQGSFDEEVEKSSIFISAASSTCFEAVVKGISTIIIESSNGLNFNTVPPQVPKRLCMTCTTKEEFKLAYLSMFENNIASNNQKRESSNKLRDTYFQKPTIDSVREMVGIIKN